MKKTILRAAAVMSICALAQPVLAAEDYRPPEMGQQRQISAYAGGTIRMALGKHERAVPKAGLTMGFLQRSGSPNGASAVRSRVAELVAFGGSAKTGPQLSIVGMEPKQLGQKLGMRSTGWIIIGGLVVAAGVAVAVGLSDLKNDLNQQ
jgi:hypothetical protein